MRAGVLLSLIRSGGLRARLALSRDLKGFLRLQFLGAASELGLLEALRSPRRPEQLCEELEVVDGSALTAFLDLGVSLGALARREGRYSLKSSSARALGSSREGVLAAAVLELVDYHADCYRHLGHHLRTGEGGDYLAGRADLVARSSRIVEPVLADYVRRTLGAAGVAPKVLEIGCGSGVYMLHAAKASPGSTGFGIELDPEVAKAAAALLTGSDLGGRFSVLCGRGLGSLPDDEARFDLVTLYNNVYYFTGDARRRLFEEIRLRLRPGGRLHVASMLRGPTAASLNLSLVLALTQGSYQLPVKDELTADLKSAGFSRISCEKLIPNEPFFAFAAGE